MELKIHYSSGIQPPSKYENKALIEALMSKIDDLDWKDERAVVWYFLVVWSVYSESEIWDIMT